MNMEETRFWALEDANLDFVIETEPHFQPYLKSGPHSLDERWKPSATNMDMIPDPAEQTVLLRKTLIRDCCMIRLLPYHPQVWAARAATFLKLGYGELASADAYKAHLLCKAASVQEMKAREPGDGSLTAKVFSTILSKLPQAENQPMEAYYVQVFSSINKTHEQAYLLMAQGLISVSTWYDARYVLQEAKKAYPMNREFKVLLNELQEKIALLKETLNVHRRDEETVETILHRGQLERVRYPWIVAEELERNAGTMRRINTQFAAASINAFVMKRPFSGEPPRGGVKEDDFGVYARRNIPQGGAILETKSLWTDCREGNDRCLACCKILWDTEIIRLNACTCVFCSEACRQEALATYHNAVCGRDFEWLNEAYRGVDRTFSDQILLMMVKILGTAVHLDCKPLRVPCVEFLKPNNDSIVPATFRLSYNIIAPIQILETLGVNIYTNLNFDFWALQTLMMRVENNRVRKQTLNDLRYNIIDPLVNMFNHSCTPSASYRYEGGGTATTVRAARDIKKGDEICISYVEPWMTEQEGRDEMWRRIGGPCECPSCRGQRRADARRLRIRQREDEDRRRAFESR